MNDGRNRRGTEGCKDCFFGNKPVGKMRADLKMMMPIHRPFIFEGFVFAPGATDFCVHDDFGMREEDVEV